MYLIDRLKKLMVNRLGLPQQTLKWNKPLETLFDSLAQLEVYLLGGTIALVLAKALVNKLFNSLAVVKIKKHSYTGS